MGLLDRLFGYGGQESLEAMHEESARIKAHLEKIDAATELKDWAAVNQELKDWADEVRASQEGQSDARK